jgi:hypothetical protein
MGETVGVGPPRLSGKASALCLVAFFALTALLIPAVLRLPRWIDFEVVLALWWAAWSVILTWLLYTGRRVSDDHQLGKPRRWFRAELPSLDWLGVLLGSSWAVGDCLFACIVLILLGLVWLLIEVAVPALVFLLYLVTAGMVAQVVNDRHRCAGRLGRALGRGLLWATVYTAPLAATVWYVHYVHRLRGGS